jgi:PAS domain S-box-containing protein
LVVLYNDEYAGLIGPAKHPRALGQPGSRVWPEIWDVIGPMLSQVMERGQATRSRDLLLHVDRGYLEEAYFSFSYSPIRDERGRVAGVFCPVIETTQNVIGERRLRTLRDLAAACPGSASEAQLFEGGTQVLARNPYDVPFAMLYKIDQERHLAELQSAVGIEAESPGCPFVIDFGQVESDPWAIEAVTRTGKAHRVKDLGRHFSSLPSGAWKIAPHSAMVLPILPPGQAHPRTVLIAAANPMRVLDEDYRTFFELIATQIASGLADAEALEAERKRAQALADVDRAKTAFFSNVSHEFRTPLTLMLGPLEEVLARSQTDLTDFSRPHLEVVHRNGLRLLKLVNSLLDFSRIEAGRVQARYEPTDLAALTVELTSCFRSAMERAGLQLIVACPPLSEAVYVDRDMWEKIVLNLLSNAFKFTFEGHIAVTLQQHEGSVELTVRDTGVGIPEEALPKLFERFYRVENLRSRTHEGSGIGLALVQELTKLHGGRISVESRVGEGSAFVLSLPLGTAHLSEDQISHQAPHRTSTLGAALYVEEALRWLPDDQRSQEDQATRYEPAAWSHAPTVRETEKARARILVADDNADMRRYIARLLAERYTVEAVMDGEAALEAARQCRPDLILTDVMMPRLDGFALLRSLRNDPTLNTVPVIILSARAGEESRVEGLEQGADDYLTKPFSARELLARVGAHLDLARVRSEADRAIRDSEARFRNMADHAPVMVWVTEPDGSCSYLSRSWYEFTGQTPDSGLGFGWLATAHPDDHVLSRETFEKITSSRQAFRLEYRLRRKDGVYRWAINAATPRLGSSGEFLGYIGSVIDITERKETERALQTATAKFESVFNQSGIFAGIVDLAGILREANDLSVTACGYRRTEVLDRPFWETPWWRGSEDTQAKIREATRQAAAGKVFQEVLRYWIADGSERVVDFAMYPIRNPSGRVMFLHPTGIDITDRVRQEEALHEAIERYDRQVRLFEGVASTTPDFVYLFDLDGRFRYANRRLLDVWGLALPDVLGKTCRQLGYEQWHHDMHMREIAEVIATKRSIKGEVAFTAPLTGISGVYEYIFAPVIGPTGDVEFISGTTRDITDRKRAEEAILHHSAQFESLVNQAPMGIYLVDADFCIAQVNPLALPAFGDMPDLIGRNFDDVIHRLWEKRYADEIVSIFRHTLETGEPYVTSERAEPRIDRGVTEYYEWRVDRITLPDGRYGLVCYFRDISSQVQARLKIAESADALQRLNNELEQRVEERTHELVASQTRLRALATELNLAEQRERKRLAADLHDYLQQTLVLGKIKLAQSKRHLSADSSCGQFMREADEALGDALRYTRTLVAELSPPVLRDHGLSAGLGWLAEFMKKHELAVTVEAPIEGINLPEDQAVLLFQSVRELLFNVRKHAGTNEALIAVEREESRLRIQVRDQGKGFTLPTQSSEEPPGTETSSKFGLFSIRERMVALGGSFDIQSTPSKGTTAILTLPLAESGAEEGGSRPASDVAPPAGSPEQPHHVPVQQAVLSSRIRVLLVDDHHMVREGLRTVLKGYPDLEIIGEAADGEEAVALVERLQPDVVVMDVNMPKMSGIEATSRIKARFPRLRVVGLSVNAGADNQEAMSRAGADGLTTKEAAVEQLYEQIRPSREP